MEVKIEVIQGDIVFENVFFVYLDMGIQVLKDVSFELKVGQKMAIIGKMGFGKFIIVDLFVCMYDVE